MSFVERSTVFLNHIEKEIKIIILTTIECNVNMSVEVVCIDFFWFRNQINFLYNEIITIFRVEDIRVSILTRLHWCGIYLLQRYQCSYVFLNYILEAKDWHLTRLRKKVVQNCLSVYIRINFSLYQPFNHRYSNIQRCFATNFNLFIGLHFCWHWLSLLPSSFPLLTYLYLYTH